MKALPVATAGLAVAGAAAISAALLWVPADPGIEPRPAPDVSVSTPAPNAPGPNASASGASAPTASLGDTPAPAGAPPRPVAERADPAWVVRVAEASGIPERALAAYAGAALTLAETDPACGLGWNTLAAIGLVESEHGSISGSVLGADGVAHPSIVGIALDGTDSLTIADTDGGRLDGDEAWDRAVGPMQFIPETWASFARDGDGDDIPNVQQIDDAALTAAAYLCDIGGDLTQPSAWIAAIHAYNPSVEYNNRVAAAATNYASVG